ncbi:hypothetical protein NKH89_10180 [Mesorhizobium sp. M0923]|uniref:hypothetical protein n=1 Tax=Mesorhizobium sp. M0923 TaxID=2957028 RepID=UPI003339F51A
MADGKIPIIGQIAEVNRELALRRNVFPIRVRDKKMKQAEADLCMRRLEAVLATLMFCQAHEADIRAFIAAKSEKSGGIMSSDPRQVTIFDLLAGGNQP